MPQEERLLGPPGPVFDGVRERVHGLVVPADEGSAKVDVLEAVLLGVEVGDLADVVAGARCQFQITYKR